MVQVQSILDMFGDKVKAREQAIDAGIPVIPGSDGPFLQLKKSQHLANQMAIQL